jgi:hypothetical protein
MSREVWNAESGIVGFALWHQSMFPCEVSRHNVDRPYLTKERQMSDHPLLVRPGSALAPAFELSNARVVATVTRGGGAVVENVRRLQCSEERLYTFECSERGGELHQFQYNFHFGEAHDADPLPFHAVEARVVITGHLTNGRRLEIRGTGWIGYADNGKVDGWFDTPPVILTEDWGSELEDSEAEEEAIPLPEGRSFPMPPQFVQAALRVPAVKDLDD